MSFICLQEAEVKGTEVGRVNVTADLLGNGGVNRKCGVLASARRRKEAG